MTSCYRGGLSATAVGISICVGPSSPRLPLRHSLLLRLLQLFTNLKNMFHSFHFLLTSAPTLPLPPRCRPPSTYSLPPRIADHPQSLMPCIVPGIVRLHFLQTNAITLFLHDLLVTDGTDRAEYCSSFLQFSLSRKAQTFSHAARRRNLALSFLQRRLVFLSTLLAQGRRGKPIHCFIREAHNHTAWKAVYHHHRPSSMSILKHSHSPRYSRTLVACRYLTILLNSIASANLCR